jgi:hypothetical protein
MFRYFALILSGILALSPAPAGMSPEEPLSAETVSESPDEAPAGMTGSGMMLVNPMQKADSLSHINEIIGCRMSFPKGYAAENESFHVFNTTPRLGQYRFTVGETEYTLRASETEDGISGFYHDGKLLGSDGSDSAVFENGIWMRRFDGTMQYSLLAEGDNLTDTEISAIFDALLPAGTSAAE